jgi:hypothetical protein
MKKPNKCYICYGTCYCDYTHLLKFLHLYHNLNSEKSKHVKVLDVTLPLANMGTNKYLTCIPEHQLPKSLKKTMGIEEEIKA